MPIPISIQPIPIQTSPTQSPPTQSTNIPGIRPYSPKSMQIGFPTNLMRFLKSSVIPKEIQNNPQLDEAIFELLKISIEAYFKIPNTPFGDSNARDLKAPKLFYLTVTNLNTDPSTTLKFENFVEKKADGQVLFRFEPLENVFNLLFSTTKDQMLLVQKLQNKIQSLGGEARKLKLLIQMGLSSFYQKNPSMKPMYDQVYIMIVILGWFLADVSQATLGTFKDLIFSILSKSLDRATTEYVEKTAINITLQTIKPNVTDKSIKLDPINVYRDLQAIYDCSLSFLPFHVIAKKIQQVKDRVGNTKFLEDQVIALLKNLNFRQCLAQLLVTYNPSQSQEEIEKSIVVPTYTPDEKTTTTNLVFLVLMCIDHFDLDKSFYTKVYNKQGLWQVLQEIPRLKKINLIEYSSKFLKIYTSELEHWNYYAWNTDGSIRDAKNLVLKPIGSTTRKSKLQLSSAAFDLDPLFKDTDSDFNKSLDAFVGMTFYDVYRAFRAQVFVTSGYFDIQSEKYLGEIFSGKMNTQMPLQAIYLFLVYCQYRISTYALKNAILFEKTDVLESPSYKVLDDTIRTVKTDPIYSPIIKFTLALSLVILIDKVVGSNAKKHKAKKTLTF